MVQILSTDADRKVEDLNDLIARSRKAIIYLDQINDERHHGVDPRLSAKSHGVREAVAALVALRDSGDLNFDATNNPLIEMILSAEGARRQGLELVAGYMRSYVSF